VEPKLKGVPETMLIPLWAKAAETQRPDAVISDPLAIEMVSNIDYAFENFSKSWLTQIGVSIRTLILDNAVRDFLKDHPGAVIVNLGAGLDTRCHRLKDCRFKCWYDLDLPEAIHLRRRFFHEHEEYKFIKTSVFEPGWLEDPDLSGESLLFIAEGLFMYFEEPQIRSLFEQIAVRCEGARMLVELLPPFLVGRSKHHDSVKELGGQAEFRWAPKKSRELEGWHRNICLLKEWNYFDFHRDRWKWFRFLAHLPIIGPGLSSRIAYLKFESE
jgi:O-methyltransferase involved in polyketide biosynthesis